MVLLFENGFSAWGQFLQSFCRSTRDMTKKLSPSLKTTLQPRGTNNIPTATQPAFEVANDQILSPILIVLIGDRKSSSATLQTLTVWSRDPEMTMEPLCATSTAETSEPWQYLQYFEKKKVKFEWDLDFRAKFDPF